MIQAVYGFCWSETPSPPEALENDFRGGCFQLCKKCLPKCASKSFLYFFYFFYRDNSGTSNAFRVNNEIDVANCMIIVSSTIAIRSASGRRLRALIRTGLIEPPRLSVVNVNVVVGILKKKKKKKMRRWIELTCPFRESM